MVTGLVLASTEVTEITVGLSTVEDTTVALGMTAKAQVPSLFSADPGGHSHVKFPGLLMHISVILQICWLFVRACKHSSTSEVTCF